MVGHTPRLTCGGSEKDMREITCNSFLCLRLVFRVQGGKELKRYGF